MGLMDRISNLLKDEEILEETVEEVEDNEEDEEEVVNNATSNNVTGVANTNKPATAARATTSVSTGAALEMKIVKPESVNEVYSIADHLLQKRTVLLNLEDTNKETTRRIIDVLTGVVYAIKGNVTKIANATYVVTPKNIDVSDENPQGDNNQNSSGNRNLVN